MVPRVPILADRLNFDLSIEVVVAMLALGVSILDLAFSAAQVWIGLIAAFREPQPVSLERKASTSRRPRSPSTAWELYKRLPSPPQYGTVLS